MPSKKAVFLFGAGAVLDWGAPKTICGGDHLTSLPNHGTNEIGNRICCLTHLITSTGLYDREGNRISETLFKILSSKNRINKPNFETIINLLEEFYNYWATKNDKDSVNLFSLINSDSDLEKFQYFEHSEVNQNSKKYSIKIPIFKNLDDQFVPNDYHPSQKYYEIFINELLGGIKGHISKYSFHTQGSNVIFNGVNEVINRNFCNWMQTFVEEDYSLRLYTLNYDRIFKILLQNANIDIFEGFELVGLSPNYNEPIRPNFQRIVSDFSSNIHYNLHGSVYWDIETENDNGLSGYSFFLVPFGQIDSPTSVVEVEKGKKMLLTNIITGYQKVQKTSVVPFRQMFSAFDRDCFEANKLIIAGYSLSDEHINDIIRNSRKYNSKLEITLINPAFNDEDFLFKFILHWGLLSYPVFRNEEKDVIVAPHYNVTIIKKKFGEFLENQLNYPKN